MAGLLCLWDRDLASVKFDLVNFTTHLWLRISQIIGRSHSFQQSFPLRSAMCRVLCPGTEVTETWSLLLKCSQTHGTDWCEDNYTG